MKLVQLNVTCDKGSTGKICVAVSQMLSAKGIENYILYASGHSDYEHGIPYMSDREVRLNALRSRILGNYGFNSKAATKRLIAKLERIAPDVVHLHNMHGHNADLDLLLTYLKDAHIKVFWTFHDCWAFTGYCPHFDMIGCAKWQTGCEHCPTRASYSWLYDNSRRLFEKKKALLTDLDLTIITPSHWLAGLVRQSFLSNILVKVIHNGINLSVFLPTPSDFRERYGFEGKKLVLGVAFDWGERKGLDVFAELAERLPDDYRIVLVGTTDRIDRQLPNSIVTIHRTHNMQELAAVYTAADVFVNPTREEALGLVNIEALACGTPGVTFRTGGSPECYDDTCGAIVEKNDIDALEQEIIRICQTAPYSQAACVQRAQAFDRQICFEKYLTLYESRFVQ